MSYTLDFSIVLGAAKTGLTLNAQIVDTVGSDVGAVVTTGFAEIGGGNYLWHATMLPDAHRGGVKFYESGVPETILAFVAINPSRTTLRSGAVKLTYLLTEPPEGSGTPITDVEVWVSTDEAGENIVASGRTDQNGEVVFWLDVGTIYMWRQKSGFNFVNPDVEEVLA